MIVGRVEKQTKIVLVNCILFLSCSNEVCFPTTCEVKLLFSTESGDFKESDEVTVDEALSL